MAQDLEDLPWAWLRRPSVDGGGARCRWGVRTEMDRFPTVDSYGYKRSCCGGRAEIDRAGGGTR